MCKYCDLIYNLVMKEIRVRYMGAVIGFAWSLANPLLTTLTYVFVFTYVFPSEQPHHALFLVTGFLVWSLFNQVVGNCAEVLSNSAPLLQKIYFPRYLVPLASVLVKVVLWLSSFVVFMAAYFFIGGQLSWALLLVPLYLTVSVLFVYGIALILAVLQVMFRDIAHLVDVALQVLFWMTPILYTIDRVPHPVDVIMKATPIAEFVIIAQSLFYYGRMPDVFVTLGFIAWTAVLFIGGITLFKKRVPLLIERL
jgi:lipopolysaccharide transport system permease protein